MSNERLQKIMARAGIDSRRNCEVMISAGRVTVNGQVAQIGMKADAAKDHISVDGRQIAAAEPLQYIAVYKPRGVISAVKAPDPRPTIIDLVQPAGRLFPVGRLDIESEGLMLLTNDGALANRLTHPRYGYEKEYRVLVDREPDERQLKGWRRGIVLEDGYKTRPAKVKIESQTPRGGVWLQIIMKEGRKRQIREIGERIGLAVIRIQRVRIGTLRLGKLKPRQWRDLTAAELKALQGPSRRSAGKKTTQKGRKKR
jgi:23S rRNA pseudouridine2605 synthase